jgi:hypothetical protein
VKHPPRIEDTLVSQILSAAVATPVAIGLTALGAMVSVTQWVLAAVTTLVPDLDRARPRHNAARVREQLRAAKQAAQKAGVLSRP